jgi:hypothetical protein
MQQVDIVVSDADLHRAAELGAAVHLDDREMSFGVEESGDAVSGQRWIYAICRHIPKCPTASGRTGKAS